MTGDNPVDNQENIYENNFINKSYNGIKVIIDLHKHGKHFLSITHYCAMCGEEYECYSNCQEKAEYDIDKKGYSIKNMDELLEFDETNDEMLKYKNGIIFFCNYKCLLKYINANEILNSIIYK